MGCKNYHPRDVCQLKECREKTCPDRHPKKCKFEDKCMFQSRCSYQHSKQTSKEQDKLQDEIKTLRAEIDQIKKDNNVRINTLAKVHLKELSDLKQENRVLNKSINDLRAKLNSEELKESQEFSKTSNKADTESDSNGMTKLKLIKYKCDHCSFEAKSTRGLKTHRGHMHKDAEKLVEYSPEIQIYICAFCENYYNNKEEFAKHAYTHPIKKNHKFTNRFHQ